MRFALFETKVYSVEMIIDLIKLENSPLELDFALASEEIDLDSEEAKLKSETSVKGVLTKSAAETEIAGNIKTIVEIECARCLSPIEKKIEIPFRAAFIQPEHYSENKETELNAEDLDVSIIENDEINLTELVREQILLNLPEQIFCSENCQGLCPKCGVNKNTQTCNCEEKEIDPRWAVLKDLKRN